MSLWSTLFGGKKKIGSYPYRLEKARSLHGQPVKYITERREENEDVIGRGGHMALHGEEFIVDSGKDTLFRCPVEHLEVSELLSGDGAVISGPNLLEGGKARTIIVHFVYYRK